jgi:hypothetical protein
MMNFSRAFYLQLRTFFLASVIMGVSHDAFALQPEAQNFQLRAEQWELVRHGERLIGVDVLNDVVRKWSLGRGLSIELQYPGGEEGELWVQELISWLISLGIPSKYLVAVPGSGEADIIKFRIIKAGDSYR